MLSSMVPLVNRDFRGWETPPIGWATIAVREELERAHSAGQPPPLVVVASARAGRLLFASVVGDADATGSASRGVLDPPVFLTPGEVAGAVLQVLRPGHIGQPVPPSWARRLAWAAAFSIASEDALRALGVPRDESDTARRDQLGGSAAEAARLHQLLGGEGLCFREVPERAGLSGVVLSDADRARWLALADIESIYVELLEQAGWTDPTLAELHAVRGLGSSGQRQGEAAGPCGVGGCPVALVVAVPELPGLARLALEVLSRTSAKPTRVLIAAPTSLADTFDEWGRPLPARWARGVPPVQGTPAPTLSDQQLDFVGNASEQAEAALVAFQRLVAATTVPAGDSAHANLHAEETVICAPDPGLAGVLQRAADHASGPGGLRLRDAAGTPLTQTAPARLLKLLARHVDRSHNTDGDGTLSTLAELLRHEDAARLLSAADGATANEPRVSVDAVLSAIDLARRWTATGVLDERSLAYMATRSDSRSVAHAADRVCAWLAPLLEAERSGCPQQIANALAGVLAIAYSGLSVDRGNPAQAGTAEAASTIASALVSLSRSAPLWARPGWAKVAPRTVAQLASIVLLSLESRVAAPTPETNAVEIVGWLELPMDPARVVVIAGLHDNAVPGGRLADAFVPDRLRSALGVSDDRGRLTRDRFLLAGLLASRRVAVVCGRSDAAGEPVRASRLVFDVGHADATDGHLQLSRRVLRAIETRQRTFRLRASSVARLPESGRSPPRRSPVSLVPAAENVRLLRPPSVRASDFASYIASPWLLWLRRLLGVDEIQVSPPDGADHGLDAVQFGTLVHAALRQFARRPEAASTDARTVRETVLGCLEDAALEVAHGERRSTSLALQLRVARRRLERFSNQQAVHAATGWRIVAAEWPDERQDGLCPVVSVLAGGEAGRVTPALHVTGRIDRVDYHPQRNAVMLIDYKTGTNANNPLAAHGGPGKWRDLQLPLYRRFVNGLIECGRLPPPASSAEVDLAYWGVAAGESDSGLAVAGWKSAELADAWAEARRIAIAIDEGDLRSIGDAEAHTPIVRSLLALARTQLAHRPPAVKPLERAGQP